MDNNAILVQNVSVEDLEKLFDNIISKRFNKINQPPSSQEDDLLTREETCKFLKIDSSTLWSWTNKGKVQAYGIGSRRYYRKSELLESLKPLSQKI